MKKCYVYEHWRLDKDVCFYVGFGSTSRRAHSKHDRNKYWKNIVNKLEKEGSTFEVKIVADGLSKEDALNLEIDRIAFWKSIGIKLTNMTNGGEGNPGGVSPMRGKSLPPEWRAKLSAVHKGKPSPKKGIPLSQEQKEKMSIYLKGRVGVKSMLGKKHTEEARKKISESNFKRWAEIKANQPEKIIIKKPKNKVAMAAHLADQKKNPAFEEKRKAGVRRAQQTSEYREKMRLNAMKRWHKEIA